MRAMQIPTTIFTTHLSTKQIQHYIRSVPARALTLSFMAPYTLRIVPLGLIFMLLWSCQQAPPERFGTLTATEFDTARASLVDTFTVKASTIQIDTITTGNIGYMQFGQYQHPWFGEIKAQSVIGIRPNTSEGILPVASVDSLVINMPFGRITGDTMSSVTFDVYLSDTLPDPSVSYKSLTTDTRPLYKVDNRIGSFTLSNIGFGPRKTVRLKSKIEGLLLGRILALKDSIDPNNPLKFARLLKGLVFVPRSGNMILTNSTVDNSLILYYKTTGSTDPKAYFFNMGGSSGHFTLISANRQGTEFASLNTTGTILPAENTSDKTILLQGGSGMRGFVEIPALGSFLRQIEAQVGKITILKAELIMPIVNDYDVAKFANFPSVFFMLEANDIKRPSRFILNDARRSLQSGFSQFGFRYSDKEILADISTYVQNVGRGTFANKGILIYLAESDITTYYLKLANNKAGNKPMKLKLYYIKQS